MASFASIQLLLIFASLSYASATFIPNFDISWGDQRDKLLPGGDTVQLTLDKWSALLSRLQPRSDRFRVYWKCDRRAIRDAHKRILSRQGQRKPSTPTPSSGTQPNSISGSA
ncbi:hypothetical protein AMTR_s00065p00198930 [Amborella trichopoda]|uniref:Uncharacterized protein n=1 Tax=Amborella trichopoda TaxID=13333 RepID=U5DE37_AMBTC|nr:hypothetical protein AMTR_s00065p00198930 [Amborella trichopoda]